MTTTCTKCDGTRVIRRTVGRKLYKHPCAHCMGEQSFYAVEIHQDNGWVWLSVDWTNNHFASKSEAEECKQHYLDTRSPDEKPRELRIAKCEVAR